MGKVTEPYNYTAVLFWVKSDAVVYAIRYFKWEIECVKISNHWFYSDFTHNISARLHLPTQLVGYINKYLLLFFYSNLSLEGALSTSLPQVLHYAVYDRA